MKVLAFDTSNQALSVALMQEGEVVAQTLLTIKKNHSISLMPTIDFLMDQLAWQPADLDRIVVAQGPGSYTGLRVAVATAKTLAWSLNIDLVGVSSLLALTELAQTGLIIPVIDARRNNVYAGFYEDGQALAPERHASLEEVLDFARAYPQVTFIGEADKFAEQIKERLPQARVVKTYPSAALLARLAEGLPGQDVDAFVPNYLKRVEAEEKWLETHQESDQEGYIKRI